MNRENKKPPAGEGEWLRRLKQLLNSDFSGRELAVKIRYAPENRRKRKRRCRRSPGYWR